ncbi:MAG: PDR/VanB family oxidoreductase, partial [Planctomycetota bacterium]
RYLEGEPDHKDLILSRNEQESCLTPCVSRAKSAMLVLDL